MMSRLLKWFRRKPPTVIVIPQALSVELTTKERADLRLWLLSPTTKLALSLVEARHPGTNVRIPAVARNEVEAYAAVNYIARIKGWEQFRNTLLTIAEPAKKDVDAVERYPSQEN
jgi:hypothetical protein